MSENDARERRLAEALRANLRRRKTQAREQASRTMDDAPPELAKRPDEPSS